MNEYLAMAGDAAPGVDVICTSTVTMEGMEDLSAMLQKGRTVIFVGSSGVGKSSLLNAAAA